MRVLRVDDEASWRERVAALEQGVSYPLGADRFSIDHGEDYFAFFRRLGEVHYFVAADGERVVGVACGILRSVPPRPGAPPAETFYVCDLKVHPEYRRRRVPWAIFAHAFPRHYARCPRGYAISMDPGDGASNPVVRLLSRFWLAPNAVAARLHLWSLDAGAMRETAPLLVAHRGPVAWRSLAGVKDIVLESTGRPMPLLHAQFGPCAEPGADAPQWGAVHMFCAPEGDPLETALRAAGLSPTASASVVAHRMGGWDWSFVLTSDI